MAQMAKSLGGEIMKNIVAVGASAAVVGLATEDFVSVIEARFGGKRGGEIVAKNMEALRHGHAYCQEHFLATIGADERARFAVPPLELPGGPKTGARSLCGAATPRATT